MTLTDKEIDRLCDVVLRALDMRHYPTTPDELMFMTAVPNDPMPRFAGTTVGEVRAAHAIALKHWLDRRRSEGMSEARLKAVQDYYAAEVPA